MLSVIICTVDPWSDAMTTVTQLAGTSSLSRQLKCCLDDKDGSRKDEEDQAESRLFLRLSVLVLLLETDMESPTE